MSVYVVDGYYSSSDSNLSAQQMDTNARGLYLLLYRLGFTPGAICAILGNCQAESGLNPGRLQGATADPIPDNQAMLTFTAGAGIVQWTPAKDTIIPFSITNNINWYSLVTQYKRLEDEYTNNYEFIGVTVNGVYYNWNIFAHFTVESIQDVNDLTEAFLRGYLRPSDPDATLRNRQYYARLWYNELKYLRPFSMLMFKNMSKPNYKKEMRTPCQRV